MNNNYKIKTIKVKSIDDKIAEAQMIRDQGIAAHDAGDHAKSEELLNKAMELFKS